ncbi:MAG TPA: hypothetical protein VM370_01855 [Candidatus Thermoplasmatota archaeon]|nr:hypothetical protein [Candidatus Thermoplasmatota archaeon]
MRRRLLLLAALWLLPSALAHGGEAGIDDQLVDNGRALQLGTFTAPQPGALVVVPYVEGALGCAPPAEADYSIALGADAGIAFAANATALAAYFDLPPQGEGYAALGVDSHDATRALILMQENAIALHALAGVVERGSALDVKTGALGVPYPIPGTAMEHAEELAAPEGGGLLLDHDGSFTGARACAGSEVGHLAILVEDSSLPDSLAPGRLVHAVAMFDATLAQFPPRPLDGTTAVLQANLYLARPGEDPARVRAALDPSIKLVADGVPILALVGGGVWVMRRP